MLPSHPYGQEEEEDDEEEEEEMITEAAEESSQDHIEVSTEDDKQAGFEMIPEEEEADQGSVNEDKADAGISLQELSLEDNKE